MPVPPSATLPRVDSDLAAVIESQQFGFNFVVRVLTPWLSRPVALRWPAR